ncbi:hypothetical protein ACXR2T_04610 [Leucobacter sp. HY1910]
MQSMTARRLAAAPMSRGERTVRGAAVAGAATLTAAASHALAGGEVTLFSVVATAILALPLSTALAHRRLGLWRLTLAVTAAQFVYHWCFAGLGLLTPGTPGTLRPPAPLHAAHLAQMQNFVPDLAAAGAADTAMWVGHALGALITIALMHRGERAARALARLVGRALPLSHPAAVTVPRTARAVCTPGVLELPQPVFFAVISHRGPPAFDDAPFS